jgi:P27 family predicted phage terminase small subunit
MPRPKKSPEAHRINRTFRRDRHADPEVTPPAAPPPVLAPPAHLTPDEAAAWGELCKAAPRGLLRAADAALIETCATALAAYRFWLLETRAVARYIGSQRGGDRLHPAFAELRRTRAQLAECLVHAGLTPATRSRLVAAGAIDAADDGAGDADDLDQFIQSLRRDARRRNHGR